MLSREILLNDLTLFQLYEIIILMEMQTLNKYERVYSWLINELELNKINHPSEDVRGWLAMLQESLEYNLSKFED